LRLCSSDTPTLWVGVLHLSLDRIKAMPVADLTEDNAHCYLWVTNGTLKHGYDVMKAWGFEVKSVITWFKFYLGLGVYYRNCTEQLLFGVKGKLPVLCNNEPNFMVTTRLEHSRKPDEQFAKIERCSPPNYLELFARRKERKGWDFWGKEIESDIVIPNYPVPKYSEKTKGEK
jgi:N6-adenosine-specific RNA methylase IME4